MRYVQIVFRDGTYYSFCCLRFKFETFDDGYNLFTGYSVNGNYEFGDVEKFRVT